MARLLTVAALAAVLASPVRAQLREPAAIPEDVQSNIRARVAAGWAPSVVIGLVDSSGLRYFAHGTTAVGGGQPVTPRTVYEIGSITKVFTAIALADMAIRGEVGLDDPVQRYLPDGMHIVSPDSAPITLRLLSAQRSGLPRMPNNLAPRDPTNPYADYGAEQMAAFFAGWTPTRAAGARYEYSNLGVGLLGFALARRDGGSYEAMVRRRVLEPLAMTQTMVTLSAEARGQLAEGSSDGRPAANWDLDALAGAGALRSSAADMARFLAAAMGLIHTPLDSAFRLAETPIFDAGSPTMRIGLGWHVLERGAMRIVWHNGGTGGYRSWVGYDPARRIGAVVLTNSGENADEVGRHLLDPTAPLAPILTAIAMPAESLEAYVGRYQLTPALTLTLTRDGVQLMTQLTGQPAFRVWPSARDEFFLKVVNAQLSFLRGTDGRVTAAILHQNGRDQRAERTP